MGAFLVIKMVYLAILDLFISSTIIAPLVVVFWISIWEFMHRSPEIFPPWWTLYVCISVLLTTGLIRRQVYNIYQKCGRFCSLILSRFFIYINMVFGVGFWKSLWTIMERNFNLTAAMVALAVGIVVLCTIGGATNLLGPPYCISVDSEPSQTLIFTSAFNIKVGYVYFYVLKFYGYQLLGLQTSCSPKSKICAIITFCIVMITI